MRNHKCGCNGRGCHQCCPQKKTFGTTGPTGATGPTGPGGTTGTTGATGAAAPADCCITVPNIAALSALPAAGLTENAQARVLTTGDLWVLDRTSACGADGITIVPANGGGLWLRQLEPNPKWACQGTWYISNAGNDENDGATPATPIQTLAELNRRLGADYNEWDGGIAQGPFTNAIRVFILDDLDPVNDPLRIHAFLREDSSLAFIGTPVVVASGSITAVNAINRPANQAWEVQGTTAFVAGQRVRITGPVGNPRIGELFWAAVDVGGGFTRISGPNRPNANPGVPNATPLPPTVGDEYVIETLPTIGIAEVDVRANNYSGPPFAPVAWVDLQIVGENGRVYNSLGNVVTIFKGCDVNGTIIGIWGGTNRHFAINCGFRNGGDYHGYQRAEISVLGGLFLETLTYCTPGAGLHFDLDALIQGGTVTSSGGHVTFGTTGIFDSPSDGVWVGLTNIGGAPGAFAWTRPEFDAVAHLYGQGNAGVGVRVTSGCIFGYDSEFAPGTVIPTITGAGGDYLLGGSQANTRYFDDAAGVYSAPVPSTWASVATFGSVHNVQKEAHILQMNDAP